MGYARPPPKSWQTWARPQLAERNSEQPVQTVQLGPPLFPFEHGELLAKGGGLQSEIVARHKEGAEVGDHRESERDHPSNVV